MVKSTTQKLSTDFGKTFSVETKLGEVVDSVLFLHTYIYIADNSCKLLYSENS